MKQVKVVFNKAVDSTQTLDSSKFKLYDNGGTSNVLGGYTNESISLQSDNQTVIITIGDNSGLTPAPVVQLTNSSNAKLVITGVADTNGTVMPDYTNSTIAVSSSTLANATGLSVTAPNTIRVTFTEPVLSSSVNNLAFTVDNGAYYVSGAAPVPSKDAVELTLGSYSWN